MLLDTPARNATTEKNRIAITTRRIGPAQLTVTKPIADNSPEIAETTVSEIAAECKRLDRAGRWAGSSGGETPMGTTSPSSVVS